MNRPGGALLLGLLLVACSTGGCGGPPGNPRSAALRLFELAREEEPPEEALRQVIDGVRLDEDRVSILEAVASLSEASAPRVLRETALPALRRTAIDVAATLPGGGSASYSFQAEEQLDGTWRVVSFQGPGVDWPRRPVRSDPGLTISAPPDGG